MPFHCQITSINTHITMNLQNLKNRPTQVPIHQHQWKQALPIKLQQSLQDPWELLFCVSQLFTLLCELLVPVANANRYLPKDFCPWVRTCARLKGNSPQPFIGGVNVTFVKQAAHLASQFVSVFAKVACPLCVWRSLCVSNFPSIFFYFPLAVFQSHCLQLLQYKLMKQNNFLYWLITFQSLNNCHRLGGSLLSSCCSLGDEEMTWNLQSPEDSVTDTMTQFYPVKQCPKYNQCPCMQDE